MGGTGVMFSSKEVTWYLMASLSWLLTRCTLLVSCVTPILRPFYDFFRNIQGYAGYYGMSLIAGSYAVLFVSLAGHAAQFGFLVLFENPREWEWARPASANFTDLTISKTLTEHMDSASFWRSAHLSFLLTREPAKSPLGLSLPPDAMLHSHPQHR